jgi:rRNA maturation RNase YbeY
MIDILNKTKSGLPASSSFFKEIKNKVLGEQYNLSLVFIGSKLSEELNKKHRKKNGPTNVLSFSLTKDSGEIFIDLSKAKKEAGVLNLDYKEFVSSLFVHALLHLKGLRHGDQMTKKESHLKKRYFDKIR